MFYKLQRSRSAQWTAFDIRYLIALAFVLSDFTKLSGERSARPPKTLAVGHFFEVMYQSGKYYNFLGVAQLITAILLVAHRFALIGTPSFFAITGNIWMIAISFHFKATWTITSVMVLVGLILLVLDKNRITSFYSYSNFQKKAYTAGIKILDHCRDHFYHASSNFVL